MPGFEPQTDVKIITIPCDAALETTPTIGELCLLGVPDGAGISIELLYVGFRANTLPVDGTNDVHCQVEWVDDSASDAVTALVAAYDLEDDTTVLIMNTVWEGSQMLDQGDVVNVDFDVTDPDTASEGAAFIVMYKIHARSASG